ncbi:MAG: DUF192 domain-containing protein [Anaerolineales bacterium]|nr:DUF192 domain-containing protein [Anaerolineales bacterium]
MTEKKTVNVVRRSTGEVLLAGARWCDGWFCKLRGLQFRRRLKPGEGLILVHPKEGVQSTSIHMFFVFFPIAAVWINSQGQVTSAQLAKPWRPYYSSPAPARYVLETAPDFLNQISVGDEVEFV